MDILTTLLARRPKGSSTANRFFCCTIIQGTKLENVSDAAGPAFQRDYSARGLAVGDLNNDGYPDIVMTENGGPVHVLMNTAQAGNNWLGLTLVAKTANPAAVGAILRWSIGGKVLTRQKTAGGSFLSSHDPREIIGAGKRAHRLGGGAVATAKPPC